MTREERLKFCKICVNKGFDRNQGIICKLTGSIAEFEESCSSFLENPELKAEVEKIEKEQKQYSNLASKEKRILNYVLDLVFFFIFSFLFGVMLGIILGLFYPEWIEIIDSGGSLAEYVLGIISGIAYYSTLEFTTGKSLAKYITKTKVVDAEGNIPKYSSILLRTLARFIPFEQFSFLGSESIGWHDKLSGTRVING